MTIQINYKISGIKKTTTNLVLFVDENFNISALKKHISNTEFSYISDLLKNSDLKKNLLFFDVNSKKTIFLIAVKEKIEASFVDGANRFQRLRYIIIPHILPLIVFVSLIHLMDAYRVFDEIVGFSASGYITSLQWMTYDYLRLDGAGNRYIGRASATSILTMIGIVIILIPIVKKTFKDQKERQQ